MAYSMTEAEYLELRDDDGGICLSCWSIAFGVEAGARNHECTDCGEYNVLSIEKALMEGKIEIVVRKPRVIRAPDNDIGPEWRRSLVHCDDEDRVEMIDYDEDGNKHRTCSV